MLGTEDADIFQYPKNYKKFAKKKFFLQKLGNRYEFRSYIPILNSKMGIVTEMK